MKNKAKPFTETGDQQAGYLIYCPGCRMAHPVNVERPNIATGARWTFNGDLQRPTFSPSLHLPGVCHSFIRDGFIQFLPDCNHRLAGQTVELPSFRYSDDPDDIE
jgi:hypothetical protein